jgi:hypothetical protein
VITFTSLKGSVTVTPKHRMVFFDYKTRKFVVYRAIDFINMSINTTDYALVHLNNKNVVETSTLLSIEVEYKQTVIVGVEVPSTYIVVRNHKDKSVTITGNSLSYAYGLQQTFGNQADQILEELESTPEVQDRMKVEEAVEEAYSIAVENNLPHKNDLRLQHLINTYLLEHIKFPVSFFVVFWLNDKYNNPLNGFTQALKEIANDELNLHTVANMNVIKKGIKSGEFDRYDVENIAKNRAELIYKEEEKWVDFLLGKEDLKGLNKDLYLYFVKYQTYLALKKLGIETEEVPKKSVVSWFDNYRDISKAQVSQQETDGVSYQNYIVDDITDLSKLEPYI